MITDTPKKEVNDDEVSCPRCGSDAKYRYGKLATGAQRFICLVCKRQFTEQSKTEVQASRPRCRRCGRTMHVYRRDNGITRFRCSDYPQCRTFEKIPTEDADQ